MDIFEFSDSEIEEFKVEAYELLDQAEQSLLSIDQGKAFLSNFDAVFRAFHSIKGASGMLGWKNLQEHMHQLEGHFQQCKAFPTLDKKQTSFFLKGIDGAKELLERKKIEFDYTFPKQSSSANSSAVAAKEAPIQTPVSPAPSAPIAAALASPAEDKSIFSATTFVIDDEPDLVEILVEILKDVGFSVEGFTSAKAALERLKVFKPDIIITDMKMPEVSGMDVLAAVNRLDPDLPVVFVSGNLSTELVIEAVSYGVFGIIEKPFSRNQIISVSLNAAMRSKINKLLNKSINLILYQYSDLDEFLREKGKNDIRTIISQELKLLLENRRQLKMLKLHASANTKSA